MSDLNLVQAFILFANIDLIFLITIASVDDIGGFKNYHLTHRLCEGWTIPL